MKEFNDKIAVITGAANGIGFGIAERCAQLGMKVVLAGINEENLLKAEQDLQKTGATTLVVRTDVSKREDVQALAQKTMDTFGAVHLLVNNAGVGAGSSIWESTWEDWAWVVDVNLWGVIHGVKVFTPIMLAQDAESHIVNVASVSGLLPAYPSAPYHVTKHAVIGLTENLYHSLAAQKAKVKVSLLCPGWVKTSILKSERNRPPELKNQASSIKNNPEALQAYRKMQESLDAGMSIQELADHLFRAIETERLYVLTDEKYLPRIRERMENILGQKIP
ncbi:MAG TPA: SDR family NAD(P)-dependent oxidoreductase [Anaerolineales bacterium]